MYIKYGHGQVSQILFSNKTAPPNHYPRPPMGYELCQSRPPFNYFLFQETHSFCLPSSDNPWPHVTHGVARHPPDYKMLLLWQHSTLYQQPPVSQQFTWWYFMGEMVHVYNCTYLHVCKLHVHVCIFAALIPGPTMSEHSCCEPGVYSINDLNQHHELPTMNSPPWTPHPELPTLNSPPSLLATCQ